LGGIVGAAGNYIRGRSLFDGAVSGATAGAMSGMMLNEYVRGSDEHRQPRSSDTTTAAAAAAAAGRQYRTNHVYSSSTGGRAGRDHDDDLSFARTAGANGLPAYPTSALSNRTRRTGASGSQRRQPRQSFRVTQVSSPDGSYTTTSVRASGGTGTVRVVRRTSQQQEDPMLAYLMASMMGDSENAGHLHHHYIGGLGGGGRGGRNIDGMSYDQLLQAFGDGTENLGASVESISSLPTAQVMINAKTGTVDLLPDASECNICLEELLH